MALLPFTAQAQDAGVTEPSQDAEVVTEETHDAGVTETPSDAEVVTEETHDAGVTETPSDAGLVTDPPPDAGAATDTSQDVSVSSDQAQDVAIVTDATQASGTIAGRVTSNKTKAALPGAQIFVRGVDVTAVSDANGRFELRLPAGTHAIAAIHPEHSTKVQDNLVVRPNQTTNVDVNLMSGALTVDDLIVSAPWIRGSVAAAMEARRQSSAASDSISAEDISRTPSSDAAGAAQRIVGVTLVDGRFVYVRGLGERYTNALLNGLPMPSPEPDKAAVPLDLIPTKVISSIDIAKTFTPDMPGDFAGGSVRIETVGVPDELVLAASLTLSANTQSTFAKGHTYDGGGTDWLGIDDGTRALPKGIPRDYQLRRGYMRGDGTAVDIPELNDAGVTLNSNMGVKPTTLGPSYSGSFVLGDGFDLGKQNRLGVISALTYGRKFSQRDEIRREFRPGGEDGALTRWVDAEIDGTRQAVRWSAFASATYEHGDAHRIRLVGFHSQLADDLAQVYGGYSANSDVMFQSVRQSFSSRALNVGQLIGEHEFDALGGAKLEWRASLSNALRSQPDTRDTVFSLNESTGQWQYRVGTESGRHFFSDQEESARSGAIDWTQPLSLFSLEHKLKLGGAATQKSRSFRARRFAYEQVPRTMIAPCGERFDSEACPANLFTDEITNGSVLRVLEGTAGTDSYDAELEIYAGYFMVDASLTDSLRLIAGPRIETTHQRIGAYDPFLNEDIDGTSVKLDDTRVLPSASLVFRASDEIQLRASGSQTLARPQLREIAPFAFADYFGGALMSGNPDLTLTRIWNGDLRFEYFPTSREVMAITAFVKDFEDPIEPIIKPGTSAYVVTYQNAKGARLYGVELEARKGLGFLHDALDDFTVIANLTLAQSEIRVKQTGADASGTVFTLTNENRPMVNQAPFVVNFTLDYDSGEGTRGRLLYGVSGAQLVEVGTQGMDDAYLHPRHSLDLTLSQELGAGLEIELEAQNLLNAEYVITQGKALDRENVSTSYRDGISLAVGVSYVH